MKKTYSMVLIAFEGHCDNLSIHTTLGWVRAEDKDSAEAAAAKQLLEDYPTNKFSNQLYRVSELPNSMK